MDKFSDFKNISPDFVKSDADFELYKLRHTAEHVFAQAVTELYPGKVTLAVAHISDTTFANDAKWEVPVNEEMFAQIEAKMQEIIDADLPLKRTEVSVEEAREMLKGNAFKLEWLQQFAAEEKSITIYSTGDKYFDLCKGPHLDSTGQIKAFKLLNIAGAYWRGDEKNAMLTRVYGTAFGSKEELEAYLFQVEEAKKRDHRRLGKSLDLFSFAPLVGGGLPLYSPRGALVRRTLNNYIEELQAQAGYTQVWTPQIAKAELFKISGHYEKYKDDMFRVISNYSDDEMFLKPMNCPQHTQIYASQIRSYRDLPIRLADFAMLYRDERPGELNGLARVRAFSTDDAHIFCREDQVDAEIDLALQMTKEVMQKLGFKYRYRLSVRDPEHPEKYIGDPAQWDKVEKWAEKIMQRNGIEYFEGKGEAAFYAPKMDLMATDALGREWQLSTVQIDFFMPERFDLSYTDAEGKQQRPVMLHRAILGSSERALMVLLEHFAGAFPAWLSPEQVRVIPITDENLEYAESLRAQLKAKGIRVEVDTDHDRMQNKIRKAQEMKVPYMLIVGKQEAEANTVSLRLRSGEEYKGMAANEFIEKLVANVAERKLEIKLD